MRRYLARDGYDVAWDMIRLAFASVADIGKAREMLGFSPDISFEDGLQQTFEWYKRSQQE